MKKVMTPTAAVAPGVEEAWRDVAASFERLCLTAGIAALAAMMEGDAGGPVRTAAVVIAGDRRPASSVSTAARCRSNGPCVRSRRPRVDVAEFGAARVEDWIGRWAMNLMLVNVSTRRFGRAVRLREGDVPMFPAPHDAGVSKSAALRRFVALSTERMRVGWRPTCPGSIC